MRDGHRRFLALLAAVGLGLLPAHAAPTPAKTPADPSAPQAPEPMELPDLADSVKATIDAEFLRPDERKDLRIRHGQAGPDDLDTPARQARWALLVGDFAHPSLRDASVPALDRADAALQRGELAEALALAGDDRSMRAVRIRVSALDQSGRFTDALAAAVPALNAIAPGSPDRPRESAALVDAVQAVAIVARLRPPAGRPGDEHRQLMSALKTARESLDRLDPLVALAEARLLYDKDNPQDAQKALETALSLNPRLAEAWLLLGQMTVSAFDLGSAERVALRLVDLGGPASPLAAQVRARAMLRQNDPELARQALAPALEAFPNRLDLLAFDAAVTALSFDESATNQRLEAIDRLAPGSPRGYYEAGRALSEARQYAWAARLLNTALERAPHWSAPAIDLGLLYVQSAEDERAVDVLQRAAASDPFNIRAANSLTLVREMLTYERIETDHFIIRFQPGLDRILASEMPPVLERLHAAVTGDTNGGLRHVPANKTFIDLMPDHRWFAVRIAGMPRIHTIAASTGPIIAMETPREGRAHTGTYDWPRVLQHEYTHTVGLSRTRNRIPHWFTEAQAVYLEHGPRDYQTAQMLARALTQDDLFDFVKINIAFVRPERPQDRAQAYAQGHWMYEYLVETFGEEAPLKLMDAYAAAVREEQAYQRVLGIGREEFFSRFRLWASEQVTSWGLLPPAGVPTIEELLEKFPPSPPADAAPADPADAMGEALPEGLKQLVRPRPRPPEPDDAWVAARLADYPDHADVLELAVSKALAANNGSPTLAMVPLIERYAKARPVDPMPHRHLARLYLALAEGGGDASGKGPADAIPHLEFLDAREDKKPTFAAQLAAIYAQRGDLDKAWAKAQRAVSIAPFEARHRELAAGIALQRSQPADARRQIEALVLLEPDQDLHKQRLEAVKKLMNPGE
jgi:cellulose synthase operon protein C